MDLLTVQGVTLPRMMYGTAWKEEATSGLVSQALAAGFRAIDTANQRRHYFEAGVGEALKKAFADGLARDELFLQTKYTFQPGQDHRLPYDPAAPFARQVEQSLDSSLEHLGVEWVDSLVLHGPASRRGLTAADREAWQGMEEQHRRGKTKLLGLSNVSAEQVAAFIQLATVPPSFVQNRCFAQLGWDREVRELCLAHGIIYQGFSLLTANPQVLKNRQVNALASELGVSAAQIVFAFAAGVGMLPLTGTTSAQHMQQDLAALQLKLTPAQLRLLSDAG